jgi:AcrR family transcriptional regulator
MYRNMPRINSEYREDAKKKIIAAALDVATVEGWSAVTLEAIAQKVGVTKGAFYSYFQNSNILMQDVILEMIRTIRNNMIESLANESDVHVALDRVSDFIFLQMRPIVPVFIQAMASGLPKDPVFREKVSGLLDENSTLIIAAFDRYQKDGQIPKEVDLPTVVRAIYGMSMGLGMMTHVLGKDARLSKQVWLEAAGRILLLDSVKKKR